MKHTKRLLALLLVMAMVMVNVPAPVFAVGTTNADGYIEVRTIEDLYNIRNDLTANYILMNDIDLGDATASGGAWDYEGRGWNPIGSGNAYSNNAFSGIFDGNGHSITGMRIYVTSLPSGVGKEIYLGLFANVSGTVQDLIVTGNVYASWSSSAKNFYVGSIAGDCSGIISNCAVNTNIDVNYSGDYTGYLYVGGLVGKALGATISSCVNDGDLSAKVGYYSYAYAGGIVGRSDASDTSVSRTYNAGTVLATYNSSTYNSSTSVGHAAGIVNGSATVTDCYNVAQIQANYTNSGSYRTGYAYGIGGSVVTTCYNIGSVSAYTSKYAVANGTLSNCYYLSGSGSSSAGATSLTEAQMKLSSVYVGFDFASTWVQNNSAEYPYPQLKNNPQDLRVIESVTLSSAPTKTEYAFGEALDLTGAQITVAIQGGDDQVLSVTEDMVSGYDAEIPGTQTVTVIYKGRTVTFDVIVNEKVYTPIYTVEDLYSIRKDLAGSYILMNDIDLTDATAKGGPWDFNGNGWNPIGSGDIYGNSAFSGELDGNGCKIIGMRIDVTTYPSGIGKEVYYGLFANITGSVHDLEFVGGSISSTITNSQIGKYVGALAGKVENATISNVVNNMDAIYVKSTNGGTNYCGGIVGYNSKSNITLCVNTTNIYSYTRGYGSSYSAYTGGIVGYGSTASISNSYNTGEIVSEGYVVSSYYSYLYSSGICGENYNSTVQNCYNTGAITSKNGDSNYAAGIALYGTVTKCYNIGVITGGSKYGIGGSTITDTYYLAGTGTSSTGATSLTEAQMLLSSMFSGFDFNSTWTQDADAVYPYPQLAMIPQDLRVIEGMELISLPSKTNYAYGESFEIDGCKIRLQIKGGDEEIVVTKDMVTGFNATKPGTQVLTITYMGKTLTFNVIVNEKVYTPIYTIEELYNVRNDLDGSYILMADIDLSAATAMGGDWDFMGNGWNPIGSGDVYGNNAFSGEFDGNGHKITGLRIDAKTVPSGTATVYIGLFANITGTVKDLTVTGNIAYSGSKDYYIGAIAGQCNGRIENCTSTVDVSGTATTYDVDGFVGGITGIANAKAVIVNCANQGNVRSNCYDGGTSSSCDYDINSAGGIAGNGDSSATISKCYNTGDVTARATSYSSSYYGVAYAAGICKVGKIDNCYNAGDVSSLRCLSYGTMYGYGIGGTASNSYNTGKVTAANYRYGVASAESKNCYYLDGTGTTSTGATALTDTQMRLQTMFVGFDFDNTWTINEYANHPYPQLQSNIQDMNESASIVSVISWPLKQEYYTGDELLLDGCMINVTYVSGRTELLSVTADMVSGFDNTIVGVQTITVTYHGGADTFPVTVITRPVVNNVEIVSQPNKTEFGVGTAFDFAGAKIKVTYEGGTTEIIGVTLDMTTGGNIHHLGKQIITVTYHGKSDTFEVTVMPVTISSLKLATLPTKLTYLEGQELDLTGMVLLTVMNTGTENQVNTGYTVSGYTGKPGTQTITIGYMGKTVSFDVTVKEKTVVSLVLKAAPKKTEYVAGQVFDPSGMMIVATYDNGETAVVEDYEISGFDNIPGLKTVVASYCGKFVAFPVSVIARVITDFKISSYPAKLDYLQYEVFDPTGLEVKATYNDGITEVVTDYEVVGFSSNPGTHIVSVAYNGWVDSFQINVSARALTHLIVVAPTKLIYEPGEEFDSTGMTVTACYNNGQQVQVFDYVVSGFDSNEPGTKTITVSYGGLDSVFSVSVSERSQIETNGSFVVDNLVGRLGEEVRVPVTVTGNTGIAGLCHEISFETMNLKFVGVELLGDFINGTLIVNEERADEGKATIVWFCSYDVKSSGAVYELIFQVQETAADGITEVDLDFADNDNGNISGENLIFGKQNGSVEVLSYWLGDLNGDRKYAMVDLVMLAQYVAGFEMTLTEKQLLSADVNEDGSIDIHDVILLNQWLLAEDF